MSRKRAPYMPPRFMPGRISSLKRCASKLNVCRRFASGLSNGDLRDAMEDRADELDEIAEDIET